MTTRRIHPHALPALCLAALLLPAAGAAWAGPGAFLQPSLQFGTLPAPDGAAIWEMALPVPGEVLALDAPDDRLSMRPSPVDGRTWLVFTARRIGPVSALLRVRGEDGRVRTVSVAGEVVAEAEFEALLLRGEVPGVVIERYVRRSGTPIEALEVPGAGLAEAVTHASGWTRLAVGLPAGVGECPGTVQVGGRPLGVQASLLESITVQGSTLLAKGFQPRRIRALDERLQSGRMSARIGVLGRLGGTWWLRSFDAVPDGPTVTFTPVGLRPITLAPNPEDRVLLAPLRHLGGEATEARFLALIPGGAAIVHPRQGRLKSLEDGSLARIGAARASRIDRNRVFAITGSGNGEWFLSSLRARRTNGAVEIRRTRYTPSLQDLIGVSPLLIGDLSSIRYPRQGGVLENLLVSVGTEQGDLRILELRRDGATIAGRIRHAMQVTDPRQLPAVQMNVLPSKTAGSGGLPIQVRAAVPGQETQVLRVDAPGSWTFLAREAFPVPFRATGVALGTPRFMLAAPNGQGADFVRYRYDGAILQGGAFGSAGASPIDYRASVRGRHAWLLGRDNDTGLGSIRFLTNGLPPGTNLPPRVDAGPDVLTSIPRVFLRANWIEADGDPVGVRWSGSNVEFTDRFARFTTAQVPRGDSRILVRAREGGFSAPAGVAGSLALEDFDVIRVGYQQTTGVDPGRAGGLITKLGRPEPNPASARTSMPFTLAEPGQAKVEVFDLHGRRVGTLLDDWLPAGGHDAVWNGLDAEGARATAGVYFVRLSAGAHVSQQRIVFVR